MSEWWHVWNIPFSELNDINLANVTEIAIGFGNEDEPAGDGTVYFDEILLRQGLAEEPFNDGAVELEWDEDPFMFEFDYDNNPLYLKPGCRLIDAGLGYIDEYPYLLGKASCAYLIPDTNNLHGVPDTNVVNIGCHYFDWHYSNAGGDGNLFPADLTGDKIANLKDFAVLAGYWQQSTLEKNDIDRSGFVDYNDLDILAYQWLRTAIVNPTIDVNVVGDGNNGFVEVGASGYSHDTQRIFLFSDGQYAGEIFGFSNGYPLGMDVSKLDSGEREFKTICVDRYSNITSSNITTTEFACPLNYLMLPDTYEPNKLLNFSAFNSSAEDVTVKVYADDGNMVWSQSYSGDSFFGSIPAEITNQYDFDYIRFDIGDGGEMLIDGAGGMEAMDAGGAGSVTRFSDPADPGFQGSVRALVILPDKYIRFFDWKSIRMVKKAFRNRGIKYVTLGGKSANYDTIALYAAKNPIKYMYIGSHGGDGKVYYPEFDHDYFEFDGITRRTWVQLYDGRCVSMKQSDTGAPSWCKHLGAWEERSKSFASIEFATLEFVYIDSCHSGRLKINSNNELVEGQPGEIGQAYDGPQSDMSFALGMDEPSRTRVYQGWWNEIPVGLPWPLPENDYQKWTHNEWEALGNEDNLEMAIIYAESQQTDLEGPEAPVNNYRLKGQGFLWELFLRDN